MVGSEATWKVRCGKKISRKIRPMTTLQKAGAEDKGSQAMHEERGRTVF